MLSSDTFAKLLSHRAPLCLSLYMPTSRYGPDVAQGRIRLRNLAAAARETLEESGVRSAEAERFIAPLHELERDDEFWRYQDQGLGCFLAKDFEGVYKLPVPVEEELHLGERFRIKPLLAQFEENLSFFVLSFSQSDVRMFRANRYDMHEIPSGSLPESLTEILARTEVQPVRNLRGTGPISGAGPTGKPRYHSEGDTPKDYLQVEIEQFVSQLARAVDDYLGSHSEPLVLNAEPQMQAIFRATCKYPHLAAEGVGKHPQALRDEALHGLSYDALKPMLQRTKQDLKDRIASLAGQGDSHASTNMYEIVPASLFGRVDTLLVACDAAVWGRVEAGGNAVAMHHHKVDGDEDLLDYAAAQTLLHGGRVYALPRREILKEAPAAALLRY